MSSLLCACGGKKPAGTTNPPDSGNGVAQSDPAAGQTGGQTSIEAGESSDLGAGDTTPVAKACAAEVAETPTPLFGEKVLIRPPVNVELVEDNPTMAQTFASSGYVSACEATVDKMYLFVFQNDKKKTPGTYMDEVITGMLTKNGYAGGTRGKNFAESDSQMDTEIEYPAANGAPPTKLYVSVKKQYDNTFVTVFVTRPNEFIALQPSFTESAASLLMLPPDA